MKTALALALALIVTPAFAQDKAQQFEPFTVNESDWKQLQAWLAEQPYKFTQPVLEWASALESRAVAAAQKKAAEKPPAKSD